MPNSVERSGPSACSSVRPEGVTLQPSKVQPSKVQPSKVQPSKVQPSKGYSTVMTAVAALMPPRLSWETAQTRTRPASLGATHSTSCSA